MDRPRNTQLTTTNDRVEMAEYEQQYHKHLHASTDDVSTAQQANWQSPLSSPRSTYAQPQEARGDVARFDTVLAEILRQIEVAGARKAIATTPHGKTEKKPTEKPGKKVTEEAAKEVAKMTAVHEASKKEHWNYSKARLCNHKVRWDSVPGRSKCEYHVYSKNANRNSSRYRCPVCRAIACGFCMKKLKRGDAL